MTKDEDAKMKEEAKEEGKAEAAPKEEAKGVDPSVNTDGSESNAADVKEPPKDEKGTEAADDKVSRKRAVLDMPPESISGKRVRKSAESFAPNSFENKKDQVTIVQGRGRRLADIPNVKEKIESYKNSSEDLAAAHKLVFPIRGRIGKATSRHRKEQLLAFSGYLAPRVEGEDEEERAKMDEEAETKMSKKAFSLKLGELKAICDVFDVDRSTSNGKMLVKDDLIDNLLDFLGAPDKKLTKGGKTTSKSKPKQAAKASTKKPKAKATKKKAAKEESEEDSEEEEEREEEAKENGMPTDKALRKWVRAYVTCFNLDKATTKHAVDTASEKFGVDLSEKKARIKELLTEEM